MWNTLLSGESWKGEFRNKTKTGKIFWERAYISPVKDKEGNITNFLGIKEIVTKEKELLHKLQQSEEELQQIVEQKTKLISIIGHDLRNPFNIILGYSELLKNNIQNYTAEKTARLLHFLHEGALQANNLLENLLAWGASQNNSILVLKSKINLKELLLRVLQLHEYQAKVKEIQFSFDINDIEILSDTEMLETILRNIISNAIKYSYKNSTIKIGAQVSGEEVLLYIQDYGTGMPEEVIKQINSDEVNISKKGTNNEKGTGLGLQIVQDFAKILEAKLDINSEEGKGTKVSLTLPIAR